MAGAIKAKKQNVNFDLPLSDSDQGKSTVDGLTVAVVQMGAASVHTSGAVTRDTCQSTGGSVLESEGARSHFCRPCANPQ